MPEPSQKDIAERLAEARELLDLPETVTFADVQRAYHLKCREQHPDLQEPQNRSKATKKMQRIIASYELLRNYFFHYPICLHPEEIARNHFDAEAWWRERFAGSFRQDES